MMVSTQTGSVRSRLVVLLAFSFLVGCVALTSSTEQGPTVEELLAASADVESYGEPRRCLRLSEYQNVTVLNKGNLLFYGNRDKVWLNRLKADCPGLRPRATLKFDLHSTSVCRLDSVTAVENHFLFWDRVSATCHLGMFEPISQAQAEMLKTELKR